MVVRVWVWIVVIGGSLLLGNSVTHAELPALRDTTPVIIAEDKTKEADCQAFVGSPQNQHPCKPGSVIFARQTTYREVKARGIQQYVVLTRDAHRNQQLQDELVTRTRHAITGAASDGQTDSITPAACTQKGFWVGSNYQSDPNNAASIRIFWEMQYTREADCRITRIVDRGKVSQLTYVWWRSCVNAGSDCTNRSIIMDAVDWKPRPPAWQGMAFDSVFGREYRHIADRPCSLCGQPYGWWKFNDL